MKPAAMGFSALLAAVVIGTSGLSAGAEPASESPTARPAGEPAATPRPRKPRQAKKPPSPNRLFQSANAQQHIDPLLGRGYQAYRQGDLAAAETAYRDLLSRDKRNPDALLGQALVHLRQGRPEEALALLDRLLAAEPRHGTALALTAGLRPTADPVQGESRLKLLLADQADTHALHFALGNLYARQRRWDDARQAYTQAAAVETGNPDYLFNLAVSLEHLRQPLLARHYYRQALAAGENQPANFDRGLAAQRLERLAP